MVSSWLVTMRWLAALTALVGVASLAHAGDSKGRVLVVVSSVSEIALQEGKTYTTGYFLNELAVPVKALMDAGYEPVFANPKGNAAQWDEHSLDANFFAGNPHELDRTKSFALSLPGLKKPLTLAMVLEQGVSHYAGVFVPGGHAPLGDLTTNSELGKLLREFHKQGKPTGLICHGPVALLSALPEPAGFIKGLTSADTARTEVASKGWPYAGYRMTVFSTAEERMAEPSQLKGKVEYYPADALAEAGAIVEAGKMWKSHVVRDRELITGRQPFSDAEFTRVFIAALDEQTKR
ncbi:MAG TPA: type 1 glutamine amidotransferase domain-containing protein [Cellvibrio sp.]|nr:type 1 glutamine amidotransferase domain-containing protein [Cellvibrio sp.]